MIGDPVHGTSRDGPGNDNQMTLKVRADGDNLALIASPRSTGFAVSWVG
jgi:hypothetical protein